MAKKGKRENGFDNQGWFRYALRFAMGYSTGTLSAPKPNTEMKNRTNLPKSR